MTDEGKKSLQGDVGDNEIISALSFALAGTHCGVTIQDRHLNYRHIFNIPSCWGTPKSATPDDHSIYGPHLGEKLALAKAAVVATGEPQKLTTLVADRVISFSIDQRTGIDEQLTVITTIHDITQVRKREATLRTLLLELSHRSKNLMSIIQGLATQSAKYSPSLDSFLKSFTGRLHAVSGAQDVLVDSNWQGASLFELARRQLVLADSDNETNVSFEGEDIELDPNQSLHIGLALHELAMLSAAQAGASNGSKKVSLKAEKRKVVDRDHVLLQWQSTAGFPDPAAQPDFGSILLEKVVPAAVSGVVEKHLSEDGVTWNLTFPLRLDPPDQKRKRRRPRGKGDA